LWCRPPWGHLSGPFQRQAVRGGPVWCVGSGACVVAATALRHCAWQAPRGGGGGCSTAPPLQACGQRLDPTRACGSCCTACVYTHTHVCDTRSLAQPMCSLVHTSLIHRCLMSSCVPSSPAPGGRWPCFQTWCASEQPRRLQASMASGRLLLLETRPIECVWA
jgi:hypothetical protein